MQVSNVGIVFASELDTKRGRLKETECSESLITRATPL